MGLIIQNIIVPDSGAECSEWISYFTKLEKKFGEVNARTIWLKTWQVNGSTSCTTKPDFNSFLKKHKIDVSNAATAAVAGITDIGGDILGMGKTLTKIMLYGAPLVLLAIIGTVLYSIAKVSKNVTPSDVSNLTPQGRAINLLTK